LNSFSYFVVNVIHRYGNLLPIYVYSNEVQVMYNLAALCDQLNNKISNDNKAQMQKGKRLFTFLGTNPLGL
jgi:membrane protein insertase Oxa1/YidC/SpoIIIJ